MATAPVQLVVRSASTAATFVVVVYVVEHVGCVDITPAVASVCPFASVTLGVIVGTASPYVTEWLDAVIVTGFWLIVTVPP